MNELHTRSQAAGVVGDAGPYSDKSPRWLKFEEAVFLDCCNQSNLIDDEDWDNGLPEGNWLNLVENYEFQTDEETRDEKRQELVNALMSVSSAWVPRPERGPAFEDFIVVQPFTLDDVEYIVDDDSLLCIAFLDPGCISLADVVDAIVKRELMDLNTDEIVPWNECPWFELNNQLRQGLTVIVRSVAMREVVISKFYKETSREMDRGMRINSRCWKTTHAMMVRHKLPADLVDLLGKFLGTGRNDFKRAHDCSVNCFMAVSRGCIERRCGAHCKNQNCFYHQPSQVDARRQAPSENWIRGRRKAQRLN